MLLLIFRQYISDGVLYKLINNFRISQNQIVNDNRLLVLVVYVL